MPGIRAHCLDWSLITIQRLRIEAEFWQPDRVLDPRPHRLRPSPKPVRPLSLAKSSRSNREPGVRRIDVPLHLDRGDWTRARGTVRVVERIEAILPDLIRETAGSFFV